MVNVGTSAKAIIAGLTAFGGTYAVAMTDGGVSTPEWVTVGVATAIAAATVWVVPNAGTSVQQIPQAQLAPQAPGAVVTRP